MTRKSFCAAALAVAAAWGLSSAARATVFLTDGFDYMDGALTTVSNGAWVVHSGDMQPIQVINDVAEVNIGFTASGSEDVNQTTLQAQPAGSTWYYATRFTFQDLRTAGAGAIGNNYFMHLSDGGNTNFRGRLYVMAPNAAMSSQFTLGLSSSSVAAGNGAIVKWATDLAFGTEYTAVVSYISSDAEAGTTMDGFSSLWINPVNSSSTSITDSAPNTNITTGTMSSIALRQPSQGATQPKVLLDIVAVGDNFDQVLAALGPATPTNNSDFNNDGDVDGDDLLVWQKGVGQTGLPTGNKSTGDANGDGNVNGTDLGIWKGHYNMAPSVAAAGAVPEPGALALAACAMLALSARRRSA